MFLRRNLNLKQLQGYREFVDPREILSDTSMSLALHGGRKIKDTVDKLIGPIEEANRRRIDFISAVAKAVENESTALWARAQLQGTGKWSGFLKKRIESKLNEMKTLKAVRFLNKLLKRILLEFQRNMEWLQQAVQPPDAPEPLGPYRLYTVGANIYRFMDDLITSLNEKNSSICALAKIQLDDRDNSIVKLTDGEQKTLRELFFAIEDRTPKLPIKIRGIKKNWFERLLIQSRAWWRDYRPGND